MMLPPQKRAIVGAGKVGLARQPSGATIVIAPEQARVRRHRVVRRRVEQDRAQRHPDRDVDRADERHVDRQVDLRRGPRQVDGDLGAVDRDRDLDPRSR